MSQLPQAGRQVTTRTLILRAALGSAALTAFETIYGAYGDPSAPDNQRDSVPFILAIAAVVCAVVFGVLVPRALRAVESASPSAGRWAAGFTITAILGLAVFWSGAPIILGAAAALTGWMARRRPMSGRVFGLAVGLGLFALGATVVWTVLSNTILS
jgi:hypothetical protein